MTVSITSGCLITVLAAGGGALIGCAIGAVPACHVYSVMGAAILLGGCTDSLLGTPWFMPLIVGMVTAWAVMNSIPAILLSSADESAIFSVLPGQRYLLHRRGHEAILLSGLGAAGGLFLILLALAFASRLLPAMHTVLSPHYHWIIWTVIVFMLMSEWPKGRTAALDPWDRFLSGSANVFAGLATFLLSGALGFLMFYRSPLPLEKSGQSLMPVFAGLFAIPWLLFNLVSRVDIPPQYPARSVEARTRELLHGIMAGTLGGAFAAFVPVVTGGIGGLLAGHATSTRDERTFLISQGASKTVYYAGGLMLLFVPGLHIAKGGAAGMLKPFWIPDPTFFPHAILALAIGGAVALLAIPLAARAVVRLMQLAGFRVLSACALVTVVILVAATTGFAGVGVMAVATGIGLVPPLFDARRMNALGVILLPLACNLSGVGAPVAAFLGLT